MRRALHLFLVLAATAVPSWAAKPVYPEYGDAKAVFDFYFDDPRHIGSALYWIRAYMNPLTEEPYNLAPEFMGIVVVVHGTEIVTLARHNYEKYRDSVERMRYYASLGVQFKVCGMAMSDFQYASDDLYDFVDIVPSAMTELAYWQQQGYGLVVPRIKEKRFAIEEIR